MFDGVNDEPLVFTVDKRLPYSIARYMTEDTRRLFTL